MTAGLPDIFAVQDEITERVVAAIEPQLHAAEHVRTQRKAPESLDAWECVVRALTQLGIQRSPAEFTEAEALCRRAIAIVRGYSQGHSLLGWALMRRWIWESEPKTDLLAEALAETRTALGLDDQDPWAHLTHGMVLWQMRRHGEAERAYRRAVELNPNFALAHALIGIPLVAQGAHEEAVKRANYALRLSPNDRFVHFYASITLVNAHFAAARYADCVVWARGADRETSRSTFVEPRPAHCVGGDAGGYAYRVGSAGHNASPATRFLDRLGKRANDTDRGDAGAPSRRATRGRGE